jgi:hypothetical protein
VRLKHGDVILFGSDSLLGVQIMPAANEDTTVEQHLRLESDLVMQRLRVRLICNPGLQARGCLALACPPMPRFS